MGCCCPRRKGTGSYEGARSCRNSEGLGPVGIWFRLGPVTRLFDLSAPEQSLTGCRTTVSNVATKSMDGAPAIAKTGPW